VRIIAASNRNLQREVNARRFRADLYYRLAVLELTLPPLRERREDLPLIVEHLLEGLGGDETAASLVTPAFLADLQHHSWPGNVRELRNYLERCLAFRAPVPLPPPDGRSLGHTVDLSVPLRVARERWVRALEEEYLEGLLQRHGNNVSAAARAAGVDRAHLHRLLTRLGIQRPGGPRSPE